MLRIEGLQKSFGGLHAVKSVSLTVKDSSIHSVIGPNGAGKTTLFNLITGAIRPDAGRVTFREADITGWSPDRLTGLGIVRTFQRTSIFKKLSVVENISVAIRSREKRTFSFLNSEFREREIREEACNILGMVGLGGRENQLAGELAHGLQRALDIAIGLALKPTLVLMDEPLAGMSSGDRDGVAALIVRLRDELGLTLVVVEHDVGIVMRLSDRITVMQQGAVIADGPPADIRNDAAVRAAYLKGEFAQ